MPFLSLLDPLHLQDRFLQFAARRGRLRPVNCCRIDEDGDFGGSTVLFDMANFTQSAKIVRPCRWRVSEAGP